MGRLEKKLGQRVAHFRRSAGITQAALAESLEVAPETISRLERGTTMPSLATMERLAGVLGVEFAELFHFRERDTAKDKATDRLLAVVRGRPAADIEMIADIAARIFGR